MTRRFLLGKFSVLVGTFLAQNLAYRGELFFWVLAQSLPLIFLGLWVEGGSRPALDYARYFFFAWLAGLFRPTGVADYLGYEIRTGRLSPLLLRPFSPVLDHLADQLSLLLVYLVLGLPVAGVLGALFPGILAGLEPARLLGYAGFLALGFAFHFALGWLLGALAFFLERSEGFLEAYYGALVFFGGLAIPLDAFSPGLRRFLAWTPLPYAVYHPAALAAGWPGARGPLPLVLWTLGVAALAGWIWRRGLLRYGAAGG